MHRLYRSAVGRWQIVCFGSFTFVPMMFGGLVAGVNKGKINVSFNMDKDYEILLLENG